MTKQKHLKQRVRSRMSKTGESYATARRHVLSKITNGDSVGERFVHLPGLNAGSTALRVLAANSGIRTPHADAFPSEAMAFGIAGGIGAGVFAFVYEADDFVSFFIAGRHLWQDETAYLAKALPRFGLKASQSETGGAKKAFENLKAGLDAGPVVAWVDLGTLPHRCMPEFWSGGGYHVITVYELDEGSGTALIGDLSDNPIEISLQDLADSRSRIRKQKNRILSLDASTGGRLDLAQSIRQGLSDCARSALEPQGFSTVGRGQMRNFTLQAFADLADKIHGSSAKNSWEKAFPPGHRLWRILVSLYDFSEHYGTGGGLMRPLFAEFLSEAGQALNDPGLASLAKRYAELGRLWTEWAESALPADVSEFNEARELLARKAELTLSQGLEAKEEIEATWKRLDELEQRCRERFPLSSQESDQLLRQLKERLLEIHRQEEASHQELLQWLA